jgi:hypothetical protein
LAIEGEPQRLQAAREAAAPLQLLERGVGSLPDQLGETVAIAGTEGRWRAAPVRFGFERSCGAPLLEQTNNERATDSKDSCDLTDRAFEMINRRRDAFAKIQRIGGHGSDLPSFRDPHPKMALPMELFACATRR